MLRPETKLTHPGGGSVPEPLSSQRGDRKKHDIPGPSPGTNEFINWKRGKDQPLGRDLCTDPQCRQLYGHRRR